MAQEAGGAKQRLLVLDAIRFAAVCAVVFQHSVMVSAHAGVTASLAALGASMWAVPLLFATSGFLSTWGGRSVDLKRRMQRILVPYAFWSVVLFAYEMEGAYRAGELGRLFRDANLAGIVFAGEAYYTLWFLAMLVWVTLIGFFVRSAKARVVGAGVALSAYLAIAVVRAGQPILSTDSVGGFLIIAPLCIYAYLAGAALSDKARPRNLVLPLGFAGAAAATDAAMYATWGTELTQPLQFAILTTGSIAALLVLWSLATSPASGGFVKVAATAGTLTLGIYVIHAPVLNIVRRLTHTRDSTSLAWAFALALIGIVVSLGVSYLMSRVRVLRPLVR